MTWVRSGGKESAVWLDSDRSRNLGLLLLIDHVSRDRCEIWVHTIFFHL